MTMLPEAVIEQMAANGKPGTRYGLRTMHLLLDAAKKLLAERNTLRAERNLLAAKFEEEATKNNELEKEKEKFKDAIRRKLPKERQGSTRHFTIRAKEADVDVYVTPNLFEDGTVGEVFLTVGAQGSLVRGLSDALGVLFSLALQHGVPLATITAKLRNTQFEPRGFTGDPEYPSTSSILDLVAQYLERRFGVER